MRTRSRHWSIVVVLTLATALLSGGNAALAAEPSPDDPAATVNGLLDTLIAKDFAEIATFVCEEKKEATAQRFDLALQFAALPPSVDVAAFIDSLTVGTVDRTVTVVSNDGATATVAVAGMLTIAADEAAAREFVRQLLDAQDQDPSDAAVDQVLPRFLSAIGAGQDLTKELVVILENGVWLVCDDFGDSPGPSPSALPAGSPGGSLALSTSPAGSVAPVPPMDPVAYEALLAAVPEPLRSSCVPDSYWQVPDPGPDPGEIASLDCDVDGSRGNYVSYSLFDSADTMNAFYDEQLLGMKGMGAVDGPGCFQGPGEGTWQHGRRFCYSFVGDANARWTDDGQLIIANAINDEGDWAALEAFVTAAGPVAR